MDWTTVGWISYAVLWVLVVVQVILTLALSRLVGQLMSRRFPGSGARIIDPGPEIGATVEGWEGVDLLGQPVRLQFPRDRGLFMLYVSPHCSTCAALLPPAKRFFKEIAAQAEGVWVMVLGSREKQIDYVRQNGLTNHLMLAEEQLPASWRLGGAPFGLWIDASGEVRAKGMVNNREHLESLHKAVETGHPSLESYVSALAEEKEQKGEWKGAVTSR